MTSGPFWVVLRFLKHMHHKTTCNTFSTIGLLRGMQSTQRKSFQQSKQAWNSRNSAVFQGQNCPNPENVPSSLAPVCGSPRTWDVIAGMVFPDGGRVQISQTCFRFKRSVVLFGDCGRFHDICMRWAMGNVVFVLHNIAAYLCHTYFRDSPAHVALRCCTTSKLIVWGDLDLGPIESSDCKRTAIFWPVAKMHVLFGYVCFPPSCCAKNAPRFLSAVATLSLVS